jgi:hypothetical protein
MSHAVQTLLGNRVKLGADELIKLIDQLGAEKMALKPMGKCRSALDQAAECAMLLGYCTETLENSGYQGEFDFAKYQAEKDKLAEDWNNVKALLLENADKFAHVALTIPDEKLPVKMNLPWGELSAEDVMVYPYWNLSYHAGQITYIGFLSE